MGVRTMAENVKERLTIIRTGYPKMKQLPDGSYSFKSQDVGDGVLRDYLYSCELNDKARTVCHIFHNSTDKPYKRYTLEVGNGKCEINEQVEEFSSDRFAHIAFPNNPLPSAFKNLGILDTIS